MTKYIHHSNTTGEFGTKDYLISDKKSEECFTLFIEFTCEKADEIIGKVVSGYKMKTEANLVKGETPLFFRRVLCDEMTEDEKYLKTPFIIKIHHDDYVAVYSRTIES